MEPVRVAYIAGSGHSGSTWLNIVLGSHPQAIDVGELNRISRFLEGASAQCACGKQADQCEFWSDVIALWTKQLGRDTVAAFPGIARNAESAARSRLLSVGARAKSHQPDYDAAMRALYESIRDRSGRSLVIDSSKVPSRAFALSQVPGLELSCIHLVREPRSFAWSSLRRIRRQWERQHGASLSDWRELRVCAASSFRWVVTNTAVQRGIRLGEIHSARTRYEDLMAKPASELARIGKLLELNLAATAESLLNGEEIVIQHVLAGNAMRRSGVLALRPNYDWIDQLPNSRARVAWTIASPLAKRYGYSRRPPPR